MPALPSGSITLLTDAKVSPVADSIRAHLIAICQEATEKKKSDGALEELIIVFPKGALLSSAISGRDQYDRSSRKLSAPTIEEPDTFNIAR